MATVTHPAAPRPLPQDANEWTDEELAAFALRRGRLHRFLRELRHNPGLLVGLALLGAFGAIGLAEVWVQGPMLATLPTNVAWANTLYPPGPTWQHPFGVQRGSGIDLLPALLQSTPWDLAIVGSILLLALGVGVALGTYAGFAGGAVDAVLTSASDVMLAVPPFFLVIVLYLGVLPFLSVNQQIPVFVGLFAVVLFPYYARPVRARSERVSREPFVEAARASGASRPHLLWKHVLPNSLFPVFAQVPVDLYNIFFVLTVFPFLGCFGNGLNINTGFYTWLTPLPSTVFPEWGDLLSVGACLGWSFVPDLNFWWMYVFPALVLLLFGLAVMLTCDGLERLMHGRVYGG